MEADRRTPFSDPFSCASIEAVVYLCRGIRRAPVALTVHWSEESPPQATSRSTFLACRRSKQKNSLQPQVLGSGLRNGSLKSTFPKVDRYAECKPNTLVYLYRGTRSQHAFWGLLDLPLWRYTNSQNEISKNTSHRTRKPERGMR